MLASVVAIFVVVVVIVASAIGVCVFLDWITMKASCRIGDQPLGHPKCLDAVYADKNLRQRTGLIFELDDKEGVRSEFCLEAITDSSDDEWASCNEDLFPFGIDDFGNHFCVRVPEESPCFVYYFDHESGESTRLVTLEEFIKTLKREMWR